MFSAEHFIWIALCAVMIALLLFFSLKYKWSFKTANLIMCGISIASELCKIFTHIKFVNGEDWSDGGYLRAVCLPFHLCSILIFIFFYLALSNNEKRKEQLVNFFVPIGLFGGLLAILMATSGVDFKEPYAYQCFVYHAGILWFALYIIATKKFTITYKGYVQNLVMLFSLTIIMLWVNGALISCGVDTVNFCFVVRPPADGLPILNLNHGWFVYYISLLATGIILLSAICLPFAYKNSKK